MLWNVIRGQMSLVGPRAERPGLVADLEWELPFYDRRELVKPGLTGWAQLRSASARRRLELGALPRPLLPQAPLDRARRDDPAADGGHRRARRSACRGPRPTRPGPGELAASALTRLASAVSAKRNA